MAKKLQTTPAGTAIYPHLTTPDTKFKEEGEYHVKINVPASSAASALIEQIDTLAATALAEAKKERVGKKPEKGQKPPKLELCSDMPYTQEEDGTVTFSLKMKAQGKRADKSVYTQKPGIFDAKGTPITTPINIGGGTLMKASFSPEPFYTPQLGAGATLRLYAVQVINLVEFAGRSAEGYGFEVEDGFEVPAEASAAGFAADDAGEAATDVAATDEF